MSKKKRPQGLKKRKKAERALYKAMRKHENARGNIFDVPEVKRAKKRYEDSIR